MKQGVSHFILYDNESSDNLKDILKPYIASGQVTYHRLDGRMRQLDAYNMAIDKYRRRFRYMAFLDCDEFLFCTGRESLYDFVDGFMNAHPHAGGLAVNWLVFGSGGHETKPEGGVLENYLTRSEKNFGPNHLVKTICNPMRVFGFDNPHNPIYRRGFCNLNENGEPAPFPTTKEVSCERIRINHYFTKSREEYVRKAARGMADNKNFRGMDAFLMHDRNEVRDTEILSHV